MTLPSLSYPLRLCPPPLVPPQDLSPLEVILDRAKAARQCLAEEKKSLSPPKHHVHQGHVKTSKKTEE